MELGTSGEPPPASCPLPAAETGQRKGKPRPFLSATHVDEGLSLARSSGTRNPWERTAKPPGIWDAVPGWEVQDAGKGTHLSTVEVCRAGRWGQLGGSAADLAGAGQGCAGVTLALAPPPGAGQLRPRITPEPLAALAAAPEPGRVPELGTGPGKAPGPGSGAAPGLGSAGRGSAPTWDKEVWMDNPSPCYFFPLM